MLEHLAVYATPEAWVSLLTLTFLEIVLGIDNIVFISITADRLPVNQQSIGRRLGLAAAMATRIALLVGIVWVMRLTEPFFYLGSIPMTGQGIILLLGGIYLVVKGILEIKEMLSLSEERAEHGEGQSHKGSLSLVRAVVTISVIDIVFSLDSVITAAGLSGQIAVMIPAVIAAIVFMMVCADWVSAFINDHPEIKLLALIFIFAIGVLLVAEGLHLHVSEWYVYFAMFFSLVVTLL